jgi:uncharacterized protein YkwD
MRFLYFLAFFISSIVNGNASTLGPTEITNFNNEALYAHNKYRIDHGYEGVKLNFDLMKLANEEANRMAKLDKLDVKNIEYNNQNLGINRAILKGVNYFSGI